MTKGAIATVFAWGLAACTSKASQCDDVAAEVERQGKTLAHAEGRVARASADGADAAALDDAAASLAAMELRDETVAAFAREYAALLHETSDAVEAVGEAATRRAPEAIERAIRALDALAAREAELVAGLNAYCQVGE
jgi:hypothetical protein